MTLIKTSRNVLLAIAIGSAATLTSGAAFAGKNTPAVDKDTLVIGLGKSIHNLDAMVTATGDSQRFAWLMFETLYRFDQKGTMVPGLATKVDVSEDGKTYTFTLREGVKFHNGEDMTSSDAVFSLKRMLDPKTKSTRRPYFIRIVESYKATDDKTFVINLKGPDGAFLNKVAGFLYIMPEDYIKSQSSSSEFSANPVGTGQYKFVSQRIGQSVDLERFSGYWGEKPPIKYLKYKVIPENSSRINALLTGEVDFIDTVPPAQIGILKKSAEIVVRNVPISSPLHVRIYSNLPNIPEYKREVRQALNYAVDKKAIIKSVLHGVGEPMAGYISKYYPYGHNENLKPYTYNPKKAKELLKKAGYPNGFKTSVYHDASISKAVVEAVVAFWSQIGVKAEIKSLDYAAWSRLNNNHQSNPMTFQQFSNAMYDPIHPISGGFTKTGTWSDYFNPEVEALVAKVESTVDTKGRDMIFKEIDKVINEDAGAVFISELYYSFAHKASLKWGPQIGAGYYIFRTASWK